MRAVIQRVNHATVEISDVAHATIGAGLLVLLGIEHEDSDEDSVWLSKKIARLRIFNDSEGIMNLDVIQTGGDILVVSQFTLHAKTKKGNRPSYIQAAPPEKAIPLYERFNRLLSDEIGKPVYTGEFGAAMNILLENSGPVTIIIDSRSRE